MGVKLIVGLGNPGRRYAGTRHNVGFDVVDRLGGRWRIDMGVEKFHAWFGKGIIGSEPVVLLKPSTFMNRSGRAVADAGRFFKLDLEDMVVVSDDTALPLGRIRVRKSGSAGGHNGLQDIIDALGTEAFCRVRIGVGAPPGSRTSYVLGRFGADEEAVVQTVRERAADAVECWVERGADAAMNRYNGDPPA